MGMSHCGILLLLVALYFLPALSFFKVKVRGGYLQTWSFGVIGLRSSNPEVEVSNRSKARAGAIDNGGDGSMSGSSSTGGVGIDGTPTYVDKQSDFIPPPLHDILDVNMETRGIIFEAVLGRDIGIEVADGGGTAEGGRP